MAQPASLLTPHPPPSFNPNQLESACTTSTHAIGTSPAQDASQGGTAKPPRELLLSSGDVTALAQQLHVPMDVLLLRLSNHTTLAACTQSELKKIIQFLRHKYQRTILVIGKKPALVHRISSMIFAPECPPAVVQNPSADGETQPPAATSQHVNTDEDLLSLCTHPAYPQCRLPLYMCTGVLARKPYGPGLAHSHVTTVPLVLDPPTCTMLSAEHHLHLRLFSRRQHMDISFDSITVHVATAKLPAPRKAHTAITPALPLDLTPHILSALQPVPPDDPPGTQISDGTFETEIRVTYPHDHSSWVEGGLVTVEVVRERSGEELAALCPTLKSNSQDDDVIAIGATVSLLCPLSHSLIGYPVRGNSCCHEQCFDLLTYTQLGCRTGRWVCPVCRQHVPFEDLGIDSIFQSLLQQSGNGTPLHRVPYTHPST